MWVGVVGGEWLVGGPVDSVVGVEAGEGLCSVCQLHTSVGFQAKRCFYVPKSPSLEFVKTVLVLISRANSGAARPRWAGNEIKGTLGLRFDFSVCELCLHWSP